MGYIRHNAIIATAWQQEAINALADIARREGAEVLIGAERTNGYSTVCVTADGSKEGWEESKKGDEQRRRIREWLRGAGAAGFHFEWCEVAYGNDDREAVVVDSEWSCVGKQETPR